MKIFLTKLVACFTVCVIAILMGGSAIADQMVQLDQPSIMAALQGYLSEAEQLAPQLDLSNQDLVDRFCLEYEAGYPGVPIDPSPTVSNSLSLWDVAGAILATQSPPPMYWDYDSGTLLDLDTNGIAAVLQSYSGTNQERANQFCNTHLPYPSLIALVPPLVSTNDTLQIVAEKIVIDKAIDDELWYIQ